MKSAFFKFRTSHIPFCRPSEIVYAYFIYKFEGGIDLTETVSLNVYRLGFFSDYEHELLVGEICDVTGCSQLESLSESLPAVRVDVGLSLHYRF